MRQLPVRLFISCPPLLGTRVVSVMYGKEVTIKSLLWFGHSGLLPGSHKGLREAQLQAKPEHKSPCRLAGGWATLLQAARRPAGPSTRLPGPPGSVPLTLAPTIPGIAGLPSRCPLEGSAAPRGGRSQKPGGQVPCLCEPCGFQCESCVSVNCVGVNRI